MALLVASAGRRAALVLTCTLTALPACTFNPTVDVKNITCTPGDENTCPEDYTCVMNTQGVARCCRGKNGTCDQIPDASTTEDARDDAGTGGPDTSMPMDATDGPDAGAAGGNGGGAGAGGRAGTGGASGGGGTDGTGTGGAGTGGRGAGGNGSGGFGTGASGTGGAVTGGKGGSADAGAGGATDGSACNPQCTIGATRCGTAGGLQQCIAVSGCPDWGTETGCGGHATCVASPTARCVCNQPPAACMNTTGSLCVDPMNLQACVADTAGCIYAQPATRCPTGMPCQGTYPTATCSCTNDPACNNVEGGVCGGGGMVVHCLRDTSTRCLVVQSTETCTGGQQCVGIAGAAACTCPAAPTACMTVTNGTVCMGNTVLSCTTNSKGCVTAATTATCTAGKPCGGALGSAACACVAVPACMGAASGKVCQSNTAYVTCGANADGCPVNMSGGTCTVTKPCQGTPGAADCMCQGAPSQTDCPTGMTAGSRCVGSMVYQCGTDGESCPSLMKTSCPMLGAETCSGTYPSAKCEKIYGYPTDLVGTGTASPATLYAVPVQIAAPLTLKRLGLFARAASMHVRMAIYTDNAGVPDTWRGSAILSSQTVASGRNEYAVNDVPTTPVVLSAGTYWIVAVFETSTMIGSGGASVPFRYQSWSPWNTPFPQAPLAASTPDSLAPFNFYVVGVP